MARLGFNTVYDIGISILGAFITHYLYVNKDEQGVFLKTGYIGKSFNFCLLKLKIYRYPGDVLPRVKIRFCKTERD
jgi:hypothetical protein